MKRPAKILIGCGATVLIVVAMLALFIAWMQGFNNPFNDRPFDRQVWLAMRDSEEHDNPRGQMAQDIRKRHLKRGMTRKEVENLLGKPDLSSSSDNPWQYILGEWSGFRMDTDTLDVHFDERGRVSGTRLHQH